jgi:hypothetical protein
MRPKKPQTKREGDLFRARLDHIINMRHELVQLASEFEWGWIDRETAPLWGSKLDLLLAESLRLAHEAENWDMR